MHLFEDDDDNEVSEAARGFSERMNSMDMKAGMRPRQMPDYRGASPMRSNATSMYEPVIDRSYPVPGTDDGGMQPQFYRRPQNGEPPEKGKGKGKWVFEPAGPPPSHMMPPNTSQGFMPPPSISMGPPPKGIGKGEPPEKGIGKGEPPGKGKGKGKFIFEPIGSQMMPPNTSQGIMPPPFIGPDPPPMLPMPPPNMAGSGVFAPGGPPPNMVGTGVFAPVGQPPSPIMPPSTRQGFMPAPSVGTQRPPPMLPMHRANMVGTGNPNFEPRTLPPQQFRRMDSPSNEKKEENGEPPVGPPPSSMMRPPPSIPVPPPSSPFLTNEAPTLRARTKQDVEQIQVDPDSDKPNKWFDVQHFLAYMFTFVCFAVFAGPTIISIQLAQDNDVAYWIGRWGNMAIIIPIFLILQHLYHTWMINQREGRRRYLFLVVPVLPSVLLMIIGGTYMSYSRFLYGQLKSDSCASHDTLPAKFRLQEAYDEAHTAWKQCAARHKKTNQGLPLRRTPVLQSCDEWDELTAENRESKPWRGYNIPKGELRPVDPDNYAHWQYLANVEASHVCGGFCEAGPSLWVTFADAGRQGGACQQFVAFKFLAVSHYATMIFFIAAGIFILSFPVYFSARSVLQNLGYGSDATLF